MSIPIGENYRLEADKNNIILYSNFPLDEEETENVKKRMRGRYGEDTVIKLNSDNWKNPKYFTSAHNALKYVAELELRKTALENMEVVVAKMDAIYEMIEKCCPNITVSSLRE